MKAERLLDVIEVAAQPPDWPSHYVLTEAGVYEYTGEAFARRDTIPKGRSVQTLAEGFKRVVQEARGDGESAVILLDSGDAIVFDLQHDPFGPEVQTWPCVRLCPAAEFRSWKDEYEEMDLLF